MNTNLSSQVRPSPRLHLLLILSLLGSSLPGAGVIDIGSRRELFVDRFLIDELRGTTLKLHTPQTAPPVEPPRPHGHYATFIRDGDRFRFYYRGEKVPDMHWRTGWEEYQFNQVTMCAESTDGIHWTLPNYGIYRHPAFPEGNVILAEDFLRWTDPVRMKPNAPGEHLYTNGTQPYFRAPHIYVALPTRFVAKRGSATDIAFMSSRGGNTYDRTFMESLIRPGLGKDGWGDRANYAALGIHQTGPWEMSILLTGGRRFTLRLDGFASVNAPFSGGEIITKPLKFSGRELEINYSTSAGGQVRVELQDAAGLPIAGFALADHDPIYGDEIARVVKWKAGTDLSRLTGQPIRLRFAMEDADLFSLRFRN